MLKFGIQLYSVRDHLAKDVPATLAGLKRAGYDYVELFDVAPAAVPQWKTMLADAGLRAVAAHVDYETVVKNTAGAADMARTLGYTDIIVPWLKFEARHEWLHAAATMNEIGARLRAEGLNLGYHNHEHEFEAVEDTTPFDIIFSVAAPENLFMELDVRWATEYGGDAIAMLREHGSRCRYLHLKERPKDGKGFTEVGRGVIDWPAIVAAGRETGVQWHIVEQDESDTDSIESARISAEYLRRF